MGSIHQQAFDNVKATIAKEVVLTYPDFTKPFEIYTDASTMQLGAVITQGKNLTQDALGLTSDRVYRWQLLLEEFAPEIVYIIVYIKEIHNMVADAISWLDYNPQVNPTSEFNYSNFGIPAKGETIVKWKAFSKLWRCYNKNDPGNKTQECNLNKVFANHSEEEEIFPLATPEIA